MRPLTILIFLVQSSCYAQPLYTRLRGGVTLEGGGIAPVMMASAEMPFMYRKRSFLNLQTGFGFYEERGGILMSTATAVTYNYLLNPYHSNQCRPDPTYRKLEVYLETGLGMSIRNPFELNPSYDSNQENKFRPSALGGFRFHLVRERWIYILKIRATPFLDRPLAPWGGIQLGLGWR